MVNNTTKHCEIVGLRPTHDESAIKSAYRGKSLEVHLDKGGTAEEFRKVRDSAERLMLRFGI